MQMWEASEHRPGDYGRWESSLWSPWHQGSHFGGSLSPTGAVEGGGGGEWIEWWTKEEEMKEDEKGGKNVSWYHSLTCATASPPPLTQKKGRNKSISRVRGICVIY